MKQARYSLMIPAIAVAFIVSAIIPVVSAEGELSADVLVGPTTGYKWNWTEGYTWQDGMGLMNDDEEPSQETLRWMMQEGARCAMMGQLDYINGDAAGDFISFELDETTGAITNYTLVTEDGETVVFDSVSVTDLAPIEVSVQGSVMLIRGDDVQIIVHDNPTGMIHIIANSTVAKVSFVASEGIEVTEGETGYREFVTVNGTGVDAVIATDDGIISMNELEGQTVLSITMDDNHAMFKAIPAFEHRNSVSEQALLQAFVQSRLAGEISVLFRNGSAIYNTMEYQYHFRIRLKEAQQNRIVLQVSSEDHEGRLVVMNMDRETLELQEREVIVKMDGAAVTKSSSPNEVLDATGQERENARYCLLTEGEMSQILIYVPSFSVHALSIETVATDLTGQLGLVALVAAVAMIGIAAIILMKRQR